MNKTLVISAIVLVAIVMGLGAVAPMMPEAFANHDTEKCENIPEERQHARNLCANHGPSFLPTP